MNLRTARLLPNTALHTAAFVAALAGLALPAAMASEIASFTYFNVPSYKLQNNAGNARRTVTVSSLSSVRRIFFQGTLRRVTAGTYASEACIGIRALVNVSPNVSVLSHQMIAQPVTASYFNADGTITVRGSMVLPVPQNYAFNGNFSSIALFQPNHLDFEFFERYDDNDADASATADSVWDNITITLDDAAPSLATNPPISGTVVSTVRYGAQSDDTLGAGGFFGTIVSNIAKPVGPRIRHVRVSGYVTGNTSYFHAPGYFAAPSISPTPTGQARLRIVRREAVLLSPNDLSPLVNSQELFVAVPETSNSTQRVLIDIPIAENNNFGKLTRNVPTSPNESYYGIDYYANCYEATDDAIQPDNIWNALKFEFFTDGQPPAQAIDFGMLSASPAGSPTVETRTATIAAGQPQWFRFEVPVPINNATGTYVDVDTEGTNLLFDTLIGLYGGEAANAGNLLASDDDDGSGNLSQFSFGALGPRGAIGTSALRNGRDGSLTPGVYYVAVVPFVSGTGLNALGADNFQVTNPDAASHPVTLNIRFNVPLACGIADVASDSLDTTYNPNGAVGPEDLDAFIAAFISNNVAVADVASDSLDTARNPNGFVGSEDLDAFIAAFVAGC